MRQQIERVHQQRLPDLCRQINAVHVPITQQIDREVIQPITPSVQVVRPYQPAGDTLFAPIQPPETRIIIQIGDSVRTTPSTSIQPEVIDITEEFPGRSTSTINFPPTPPHSGESRGHPFATYLQEIGVVYEEENFFENLTDIQDNRCQFQLFKEQKERSRLERLEMVENKKQAEFLKTKEAAEIRRKTEKDVRKRLDEERQLIEDHKKKREIEKAKEDANK